MTRLIPYTHRQGKADHHRGENTVELTGSELQALSYYRIQKKKIENWEDGLSDMEYAVYRLLPFGTRARLLRRVLANEELVNIFGGWFSREIPHPQYETALVFS